MGNSELLEVEGNVYICNGPRRLGMTMKEESSIASVLPTTSF
jgi:hypothetical protein